MRRFLMLLGVAAVAGAMYVAAAPGSQQSKGPTAKQFKALQKEVSSLNRHVASLSTTLDTVKTEADAAATIIGGCYLTSSGSSAKFAVLPVAQFGATGYGYFFGTNTTYAQTSALNVDNGTSNSVLAYLQEVNPTCLTSGALRHGALHSASGRLVPWGKRTR